MLTDVHTLLVVASIFRMSGLSQAKSNKALYDSAGGRSKQVDLKCTASQ